jgi:hypothetical protein
MSENDDLKIAIERLTKAIRRSNNLAWSVLRGLFYSVGWIIGLALIATLVVYLLPNIGDSNIIGRFIREMANATK